MGSQKGAAVASKTGEWGGIDGSRHLGFLLLYAGHIHGL
jgi:hypothetical protein